MCGVNGILLRREQGSDIESIVKKMCQVTHHRGPDETNVRRYGNIALGHNRLTIIDPAGGHQPFESGSIVLTYNGEIYNYLEIKKELLEKGVEFQENSDTEVLAKAIETWGDYAVDKLNGDFAFAYFNEQAQTITLIRDRVGVKPLYYYVDENVVVFSSECKGVIGALQELYSGWQPKISKLGLVETFLYGQPIPPNSFFSGITCVKPGEIVHFYPDQPTESRRYWEPELDKNLVVEGKTINQGLRKATQLRVQSDFDYSLMLSGGLDSSLLTYIVGDIESGKRAYTLGDAKSSDHSPKSFMSGSDLSFARMVASEAQQNLIECGSDGNCLVSSIKKIASAKDSPVTLINEVGMSTIFRDASQKDKVIISGDGADELFLGYFMLTDITNGVDAFYSSKNSKFLFLFFNPLFLKRAEAISMANNNFSQRLRTVSEEIKNDPEHLMHYLQLRFTLPYLLDRADRISSSYSMELRVPYCDHNLIDLAFNMAKEMKLTKVEKKSLRDAFADDFNREVLYRKKSVFPFSEEDKQLETLRQECMRVLRKNQGTNIISDIFHSKRLKLMFRNRYTFLLVKRFVGTFYLQALMCQLISISHLEDEYGLAA